MERWDDNNDKLTLSDEERLLKEPNDSSGELLTGKSPSVIGDEVIIPTLGEFSGGAKGITSDRSRSVSPVGVDHRPKQDFTESESVVQTELDLVREGDTELSKKGKTPKTINYKTSKTKSPRTKSAIAAKGVAKSLKLSNVGGATNIEEECVFADFDELSNVDDNSSAEDSSSESSSSSSSSSSTSEDERYHRRKRKHKKRRKDRKVKKRRRTKHSSSPQKGGRVKGKGKTSKQSSDSPGVNELIAVALEKQRVEMERYMKDIQSKHDQQLKELSQMKTPKSSKKTPAVMKSPSESILYVPAVKRGSIPPTTVDKATNNDNNVLLSMTRFISNIRQQLTFADRDARLGENKEATETEHATREATEAVAAAQMLKRNSRDAAESAVIQAEKFKAQVFNPKGTCFNLIDNLEASKRVVNDDDYLHVSCHVEENLAVQCKRGDYVEMIKLRPKSKTQMTNQDEQKIDIVTKDGHSYLVAGNREAHGKITSVRQWEQCFRVYASLYSEANPTRASEIWQYVEIINQAAATFVWENVALYDFHFRKHMAKYPARSFAGQKFTIKCGILTSKNTSQ